MTSQSIRGDVFPDYEKYCDALWQERTSNKTQNGRTKTCFSVKFGKPGKKELCDI